MLPMFHRGDDAFGLHAVDDLVGINRTVGIEDGMDEVRDLFRGDACRWVRSFACNE